MKKREIFQFFANPFVVIADIMVALVFIVSLFLLATTVYSEQMELIALRDARRKAIAASLGDELLHAGLISDSKPQGTDLKYRLGQTLEVEDDGSLQRFRFVAGQLGFRRNSTQLADQQGALHVLQTFGRVLLLQRARIKSVVIEGHAGSDEQSQWQLSEMRAERVRQILAIKGVLGNITEDYGSPVYKFMTSHTLDGQKLWEPQRFHEWHLQEYQARRAPGNGKMGVLPAAWVIASGRGDQVRREPLVEFKVEYTERDAPPLDDYLLTLPEQLQAEARQAGVLR